MEINKLLELQSDLKDDLLAINQVLEKVRNRLINLANGKILKGDEVVGWLGEIYGKVLFNVS